MEESSMNDYSRAGTPVMRILDHGRFLLSEEKAKALAPRFDPGVGDFARHLAAGHMTGGPIA